MDFPILSLIDEERAEEWLLNHFHPQGLYCPHCDASVEKTRHFRTTPVGSVCNRTISVNLGVPNPVGSVCNRTGSYGINPLQSRPDDMFIENVVTPISSAP